MGAGGRAAKRLGSRQVVEISEAEDLQKAFARAVEEGAAQIVGPAYDSNQVALHQLPQYLAARDAADGFDFGSHDRLTICDHGQSFHSRRGQANLDGPLE